MNKETIDIDTFYTASRQNIMIDVRTPAEFKAGHIPGAINLPLFSNEERAVVGTIYANDGQCPAIEKGLEFVGPKLAQLVKTARKIAQEREIRLYCWKGGMRSNSMAWLLRTSGLKCRVLEGGYKTWRRAFGELLQSENWRFIVLGGYTGCGKTDILNALSEQGEQVVDLEEMAQHKGSAFGGIGQSEQPTTEMFENELHALVRSFDPARPVWCEGESITIGQVYIPNPFFLLMQQAAFVFFEIPEEQRLIRLVKEYGTYPAEQLSNAFRKITRRLGGENTTNALNYLETGHIKEAATIALHYYDKCYRHAIENQMRQSINITSETDDPEKSAIQIKNKLTELRMI